MDSQDLRWMRRALDLAERGRGYVEPNPLVGAVLVRDGELVGEGWHRRFGEAHAEVNAIATAGEAARGATLYVTLEPCCHQGKTPPCTDAILRAGIARVAAALADPFPAVAGQGAQCLRAAGIAIAFGLCEAEARRQNAPYLKLLETGRPYVHAKWAMTLDGKICTRSGDSKWISNAASRQRVHALRGRMDAIVTGIGTVLADDPALTARPPGPRVATRVVLDSQGRLPPTAQLALTARSVPTLVATTRADLLNALLDQGCEVLPLPAENGHPSIPALLEELGKRRMTNVLVEAGAGVLGGFLDARALDEVHVYVAPRLVGGKDARSPIGGRGVEQLAEALRLSDLEVESIEGDLLIHARCGR